MKIVKSFLARRKFLLALIVIFGLFEKISCKEVKCESVKWQDNPLLGRLKECKIKRARIDSTGFMIASTDQGITELEFFENKEISYLPEGLADTFPDLILINAPGCSIKTVNNENFQRLGKLKFLGLDSNQIEKIEVGTFDDLISLEWLLLSKEKRKISFKLLTLS